jgi:putative oxidoreductase
MKAVFLLGRVLFGGFFLYNGINHLKSRAALTPYAQAKGVPNPEIAVPASGALLLASGASLLLGMRPKLGALGVVGFLAITSLSMHDFWNAADPSQSQNDMIHFSKNMALLGAALALMSVEEPWPVSFGRKS